MGLIEVMSGNVLVSGVVILSLATVLFTVVRRETRLKTESAWSGEDPVYLFFAPLLTLLIALGVGMTWIGASSLGEQAVTGGAIAVAAAAIIVAGVTVHLASRDGQLADRAPGARTASVTS